MRLLLVFMAVAVALPIGALRAQSLQEQAMCAAQAKKTFEEDSNQWDSESKNMKLGMQTISSDYQSHYNTKLGHCLILTTRMYSFGGETTTSKNLYDAFERRDYASYLWTTRTGKKYWEVSPISCQFGPSYGQTKFCKTEDEFNTFVSEYMQQ
jgi:hypothetical protein